MDRPHAALAGDHLADVAHVRRNRRRGLAVGVCSGPAGRRCRGVAGRGGPRHAAAADVRIEEGGRLVGVEDGGGPVVGLEGGDPVVDEHGRLGSGRVVAARNGTGRHV